MPTPVAHSLAGLALYLGASERRRPPDLPLLGGAVVSACLADLDFGLGFLTGENYHHYSTHSLGFATIFLVAVGVASKLLRRPHPRRDALVLATAYLSHLLLDMLSKDTSAPYGVELFWPFSDAFVISPVRIFDDIWRGTIAKLFGIHNWLAVAREVALVGPAVAAAYWWRARRERPF